MTALNHHSLRQPTWAFLVRSQIPRRAVLKLPLVCHRVETSCQDLELLRAVIPTTRVALGCPSLLEVNAWRLRGRHLSQHVLALDPYRLSLVPDGKVGLPVSVDVLNSRYVRHCSKRTSKVHLGHAALHCGEQPKSRLERAKQFIDTQAHLFEDRMLSGDTIN